MKKIYIAGAISGNDNYIEDFKKAEEKLKKLGYVVINPVKNLGFTYREYIDMGLCELMKCNEIYMLKNYRNSQGALLELQYALICGLNIIYQGKND